MGNKRRRDLRSEQCMTQPSSPHTGRAQSQTENTKQMEALQTRIKATLETGSPHRTTVNGLAVRITYDNAHGVLRATTVKTQQRPAELIIEADNAKDLALAIEEAAR